jgi:hypothetical protein
VVVQNVSLTGPLSFDSSGFRVSGTITSDTGQNGLTITNELFDMKKSDYQVGQKFASITGVVTYFFNFHIAPRSRDDLVMAP